MHFAVDFDETIAQSYRGFSRIPGPGFGKVENGKADLANWNDLYDILGGFDTSLEVFRTAGMWENLQHTEPFADAIDVLNRLHRAGARFTIMSDRHPDTRESMIRWLDHHGVPYEKVYGEAMPDKIKVCRELGIEAVIDDKPATMQAAHEAGFFVTTLVGPYNESTAAMHGIPVADDWLGIERIILAKHPNLRLPVTA